MAAVLMQSLESNDWTVRADLWMAPAQLSRKPLLQLAGLEFDQIEQWEQTLKQKFSAEVDVLVPLKL